MTIEKLEKRKKLEKLGELLYKFEIVTGSRFNNNLKIVDNNSLVEATKSYENVHAINFEFEMWNASYDLFVVEEKNKNTALIHSVELYEGEYNIDQQLDVTILEISKLISELNKEDVKEILVLEKRKKDRFKELSWQIAEHEDNRNSDGSILLHTGSVVKEIYKDTLVNFLDDTNIDYTDVKALSEAFEKEGNNFEETLLHWFENIIEIKDDKVIFNFKDEDTVFEFHTPNGTTWGVNDYWGTDVKETLGRYSRGISELLYKTYDLIHYDIIDDEDEK